MKQAEDIDYPGATATMIADAVNTGRWSAEAVVTACLERCGALENDLQAWVVLDADRALAAARTIDSVDSPLPLKGVPVGIKDIFDTADLPTAYGSPIYRDHQPAADAACVALARAGGAIVIGKTVTTEFAANNPAATRNPCNLNRSPGGSSSGSAAAVAAAMVPLSNGTQTAGSVIRPASYCGVVGYKPGFRLTPRAGLKLSAESLDTVGFFARTIGDAALFAAVSSGHLPERIEAEHPAPPRFALCRPPVWAPADPLMRDLVDAFASDLEAAGASVDEMVLPAAFDGLADAQWTVMVYEICQSLAHERLNRRSDCSPNLQAIFDQGESVQTATYRDAVAAGRACRLLLNDLMQQPDIDALLFPSAPGEAPGMAEGTGDPIMNRVWTFLHCPCLSLPLLTGPSGMPIGLQLIGRRGADHALLAAGAWIESHFPFQRNLASELT